MRRPYLSPRTALLILALGTCPQGHTSSAAPAPAVPRALGKRLALWQHAGAASLTARYVLTRKTSLLWDPLVVHGTLTFVAPDRLELRDDEPTGATTRIAGASITIAANDPRLPPGPAAQTTPASTWLLDRLLALFAARDPDALLRDTRASVPRGPGHQLELSPPRTHPAQRWIDRLRVRLDPDTGAVIELELVLTNGDRITLELTGHRPDETPPV